eukprot:3230891-Karenia_brevis.AAC.1
MTSEDHDNNQERQREIRDMLNEDVNQGGPEPEIVSSEERSPTFTPEEEESEGGVEVVEEVDRRNERLTREVWVLECESRLNPHA